MSGTPTPGSATDTIFALASGAGRAAIAVVRLSGRQTATIVGHLCTLPPPRQAALRKLRGMDGAILDHALVLWLPGPGSYTGEDSAELHLHGGRAVLQAVTGALLAAGARPADAGEFTRRAYLAGRMSLLEAEAVADLSVADTESQRKQALRQLGGSASAAVAGWTDRLTHCLAWQEALIDFPEEAGAADAGLEVQLRGLLTELEAQSAAATIGERVRHGLEFVIAGPPNAGKSSLFNTLAGRDAAIVSPVAGTTRDTLEVLLELGGVAVTLVDTAGLRDSEDGIEAEGVRRALHRARAADLVLHVTACDAPLASTPDLPGEILQIGSKCDLAPPRRGQHGVSVTTGEGLDALVAQMAERARRLTASAADPLLSRARHCAAIRDAAAHTRAALSAPEVELRAEELRLARAALGRLTGTLDTEALLDVVFGAFCIGK